MRKRNRWTRLLAMILAVAMVLSSQSVTALATQFGIVVNNGTNETETPDETKPADENDSETNSLPSPDQSAETTVNKPGIITAETSVNLREEPGTDSTVITQLENGTSVTVVSQISVSGADSEEELWYRVKYEEGNVEGYVHSDYVVLEQANTMLLEGDETDESEETPESESPSVDDTAESYYGKNASNRQTVATVSIRKDFSGTTVKAGETVNYIINYTLRAAANYGYANQAQSLYDTYDDTEIRLKLPSGLSIDTTTAISGVTASYDTVTGEYVFTLANDSINAQSATSGSFSIPVYVEGNGSLEIGHAFDMDGAAEYLKIITHFTVKDKTDEENIRDVETYTQTNATSSVLDTLTSTTDDEWGIEKSHVENTVSSDRSQVTVRFLLKVGLIQRTEESGEIREEIVSDEGVYARVGRVPFANGSTIDLTDTLAELKDRLGTTTIRPVSITVTENFGDQTPHSVTSGTETSVAVNTCGAKGISGVASSAPYYSEYYVDVVYPYEKFIAQYYDTNRDPLTITNTASISYTLKGGSEDTDSSTATASIGEVTSPAELTIQKYVLGYGESGQGTLYAYTANGWAPVSGPAGFTITNTDGKGATLYTRVSNGDGTYTYSTLSTDGTVSIDPSVSGADGTVTVYLDPGAYTIEETTVPVNTVSKTEAQNRTLTAGENTTVSFTNQELLGTIRIEKQGTVNGNTSGLNGAQFGLYADTDPDCAGDPLRTGTTAAEGNTKGILEFDRLISGTYYVKEILAPEGYIADTQIWTVEITEADNVVTVTVNGNTDSNVTDRIQSTNISNTAYLQLQKQYRWFGSTTSNENWQNVNNGNYRLFDDAFTLLRSTNNTLSKEQWEVVATNLDLSSSGTYLSSALDVYDANGNLYYYCFKEVLPDNWHAAGETTETTADGTRRIVYSDSVTLNEKQGHASSDPQKIVMQNTQNGTLTLTKRFVTINAQGQKVVSTANSSKAASFDLYQEINGVYTKVNTDSYTTNASGQITVPNLLAMDVSGNIVNYYWVETTGTGYLQESSANNVTTINVGTGNGQTQTLTAVGPFNFSSDTAAGGANLNQSVTVTNVEQKVPVKILKIDENTKSYLPGAKITIYRGSVESDNIVTGYNDVEIPEGGLTAVLETGYKYIIRETTVPPHYTGVTDIEIDLTDKTVASTGSDLETKTLSNKPDPSVTITKNRKNADGSTTTLAGTSFEVYTKNTDGSFDRVTENGQGVTLVSGTPLYLKAGTYYLHEVVTSDMQVLNPDDYEEQYESYDHEYDDTNNVFYFGPYTVKDQMPTQSLGTITNISSLGNVQVKKTDEEGNPLKGAELEIYYKGADGEHVVQTLETPESGVVTFTGLQVYESDGTKRTYYIREKTAPEGYYSDGTELETTLIEGEQITTVNGATGESAKPLTLVNKEETTFTVKKVYYDVWEHSFTNTEISLQGAEIALYRKTTNGYEFVEMKSTDVLGQVTFEGLTQEGEYVAVEYSIPDREELKFVEPENGKLLSEDYPLNPSTTLTEDQLKNYNVVSRQETAVQTMTNVINWTQLRIYKFKMVYGDDATVEDVEVPQNYATFELYQQILPENTPENAELTFDASNCTLVGTYNSGTLADENGDSLDGWFATDILDSADNIVYWLVETDAGLGAEIIPEENYVLFRREGMQYTNNSNGGRSKKTGTYPDNTFGTYEMENDATYGDGSIQVADIRLSKWAGTLDENNDKVKDSFSALGGAKYELWVANESGELIEKLQDMTTGLESDPNTGALSSYIISDTMYYERDKFSRFEDSEEENNEDDITWSDESYSYVRMAIREVYAPQGYQMDTRTYYMIVRFVPSDGSDANAIHNDMYFVGSGTEKVPLAEDQASDKIVWAQQGEQYRLVNWPEDNFSVAVNKYGYLPEEGVTTNMTSEELDANFDSLENLRPLSGVSMRLERLDGSTWRGYDYINQTWADGDENVFTTDATGRFTFPGGLEIGSYRIIEDLETVPSGYEALYDGSEIGGTVAARYFEVTNQSVTVNMYNPEKISIQVGKQTLEDEPKPVSGLTFSLTRPGASSVAYTALTDASGFAQISHISSGKYYLSETSSAYSTEYLEEYIEENYTGLSDFVDSGKGISLGYTRTVKDGDIVIESVWDLADYGVSEGTNLVIQDPPLVNLTIKKTDENGSALQGAVFSVYYRPFTSFTGEQTINVSYTGAERIVNRQTTGTDGQILLNNQDPGVYYIVEDSAPNGYDRAEDSDRIIVLTGGMNVTIPDNAAYTVHETTAAAEVSLSNTSRAGISVAKTVVVNEMDEPADYSFTFNLYSSATGTEKIDSVTVTKAEPRKTFSTTLSRGQTYYLEEEDAVGYVLSSLTASGITFMRQDNGRYAFTVPASGDIEVQAQNTYQYAKVTILKANGNTGEGLTGASFELQYSDGTPVPSSMVTWSSAAGEYTAVVRLDPEKKDNNGEISYRIKETLAPEGYLASEEFINVTLAPGEVQEHGTWDGGMTDAKMREALIMPNYNGVTFTVTKYGNMHGSGGSVQKDITFRLYVWSENEGGYIHQESAATDENGVASFTVASGHQYALAEEQIPTGYVDLEGIWKVSGQSETEITETASPKAESDTRTLYVLGNANDFEAGESYAFTAYNIPQLELEVRKADALDGTVIPKAKISVYEVESGTKTELTPSEVEALEIEENRIAQVTTTKDGSGYSYMDGISIEPDKTYLIVEDQAVEGFDSIITDDNRVVWYQVLAVPAGTTAKQIVTLENVNGGTSLELTKSSNLSGTQTSLFNSDLDVVYTLKPEVSNTYALDSFVLNDTGLTAFHTGQEDPLDFDMYLKNQYSITGITLGQASHTVSMYKAALNNAAASVISAHVTFFDFDGEKAYETTVTVSDESKTVNVPASVTEKIKNVSVEYFSEGLEAATGYALGQGFNPGTVTVAVTLDQQAGAEGKLSIDRIVNNADAELTWREWSSEGVQAQEEDRLSLSDEDMAENTFSTQQAPVAGVTKTADRSTVELGESVTYTLTMNNSSVNGLAIQKPVLVDLLPEGVTVDSTGNYVQMPEGSGYTVSSVRTINVGERVAVVIELKEDLPAGQSVSVNLTVNIGSGVVSHGNTMKNLVFATSGVKGVENANNPTGSAIFKNSSGEWAERLSVLAAAQGVPSDQIALLVAGLGEMGSYGYVSSSNEITWTSGSSVTLVKENYGNLDQNDGMSYSSSRLARVSNGGEVFYRLTVRNAQESGENYTRLAVMDALPATGDITLSGLSRLSDWPVYLKSIDSVTVDGKGVNYTVYYYQGTVTAATYQAVSQIQSGTVPSEWSSTAPADMKDVTAFIIAVDPRTELASGKNLIVTYTAGVDTYDAVDLDEISYLNTVNNFMFHYNSYRPSVETAEDAVSQEIMESNSVSATIIPAQVQVGGHVWIDADGDGTQDDGSISQYSNYTIVQDLLNKIQITLNTYTDRTTGRGTSSSTNSETYSKGENWDAHYVFRDLDAGVLTVDPSMAYDSNGNLITRFLKGTNPATYIMTATLQNVVGDFVLTKMLGSGISQEPGNIPTSEQQDNNFDTATGSIMSERFYLWPTVVDESDEKTWDNTKDIGFVLYRSLDLTKTAADDPETLLEGAEFEIYGPFDAGEVTKDNVASKIASGSKVTMEDGEGTYRTGSDGKLKDVPKLLWFKEYVIVETKTVDGYKMEGATASGANVSELADHTWLLEVPDEDSMVTTDTVTIGNVRETEVELKATKNFSGKNLTDNTFTFQLLAADGQTVLDRKTTAKVDAATATVTFTEQTVQGVGDHTFYIKETVPQTNPCGGVTYDTVTYRVVVTTSWNATEKELKVDSISYYKGNDTTPSQSGAVFSNSYAATGSWTPEGTKTLTGRDMKQGETFTFSVREVASADAYDPEDSETYTEVSTGTVAGGKNGQAANITFTPVSYGLTDAGDHTYVIVETGNAGPGIKLDDTVFVVTVQVSDNKDGTLKAVPTYLQGGIFFENEYEVKPTTKQLSAVKSFSSNSDERPAANKKNFTFEIDFAENGNPGNGAVLPEKKTISVTDAGSADFDAITFNKAGTYIFKITETQGTEGGYTYDNSVWTATVIVEDVNAQLTVTSTQYAKGGVLQSSATAAGFENEYHVTQTTYGPAVKKTVKGDVPAGTDQTFTFVLDNAGGTAQNGATLPSDKDITITGSGTESFDDITFAKAGTYNFSISETGGNVPGYSYDGTIWTLTVKVEDQEGKLTVTEHTYTATGHTASTEEAAFENTYKPTEITYAPRVKKGLSGDPVTTNKTFNFTLAQETAQEGVTLGRTTASVTGAGTGNFGAITFTKAGDFTFTISETEGSDSGYTYDKESWTLTVKVRDTNGALGISETSYSKTGASPSTEEAVFTNTYKLTKTSYTPKVEKRLTGDRTPSDQTYTFDLAAAADNPQGAVLGENTASVTGTGDDEFGAITFTRPGTFRFTITEHTNNQPAGYTYDTSQWTLTVVVEDKDSQLTVISHVYRLDQNTSSNDQATFTNKYEVKDTSYTPQVKKEITGAETPVDKTFTFTLENVEGNPAGYVLPASLTTTVTGENTGSFQAIRFEAAGEYNFKIRETVGTENGYGYDGSEWNLYIKVEDKDSQLTVTEHTYTKVGADPAVTETDAAVFSNTYTTKDTSYIPWVSKTLAGDVRPSEKNFTFVLAADRENPEGAQLGTTQTSVTGEGRNSFGAIQFTKAGTYRFNITETDSNENGYTYDASQWTLTVVVEDKDSQLTVTSHTYSKGTGTVNQTEAAFENNYQVTETTYAPQVSKTLTGENRPSEKTFAFTLTADAGNPEGAQLGTAQTTVTGAGTAAFGAITFTKAGTYYFSIAETDSNENGYTYDASQWTLMVVVEDKDSQLTVTSHTYSKGTESENGTAAAFTNDYQVTGTEYAPQVEKTVTGDTPEDETFTFSLTADADNPQGAALPQDTEITVTGSGEEEFGNITFTKAGTYNFEIRETNSGVPGYTYDGSIWTLTITVTDVDSILTITDENVTYSKTVAGENTESHESAAFTNRYDTTATGYTPWVNKVLTGETTPTDKTFNFTLEAKEDYGTDIAIAENGDQTSVEGAGTANFGEITFNKRGTYEFTIKETAGSDAGYSYDGSEWTLTVVVEDVDSILTVASHTYTKTGDAEAENEDYAEFSNDYQVTSTEYIPAVEKTVTGTPANDETFTFVIAAASENPEGAALPADTEITVEGSGSAQFDAIDFTKAGTYSFVITETAGGETWYEYDGSEWTLTVTVEDHESVLEVTDVVYAKDGAVQEEAQAASFTNSYHASGTLTLDNFSKALTGSPLAEGQFTFTLTDADGKVLQTVTNGADGSIAFEPLTYDETDIGQTYTYTVAEINGNVTGITYDETVYTVNVAVADSANSDGTLAVTTEILNGDQAVEGEGDALPEITFENTFSGSVTLTKQGEDGRLLAGAEFTLYARGEGDAYEVYATEGNAQGIYTTGANGQLQVTNLPANDYYFVETQAPAGYVIQTDAQGEPLHYEFRIGVMDGAAGIVENAQVNAALTVTNPGATNGSIQVTKRVSQIDDNFDIVDLTARNMTFYVGLFTDAAGTQPYGTDYIRQITMDGVSVSEPVTFTGLPSGTYYVLETTADGTPIAMNQQQQGADGSSFYCTVEGGGSNAGVIDLTVSSEPGTIALQNVYAELPEEGYYWEGSLEITKRVLRDGQAVTADDTFYAGVYQLNEAGAYELVTEVELRQNDTVTVTGLSGPVGGSMTYYVFETDGNGNMISDDPNFMYSVSGEGSVTITEADTTGRVTITNEAVEETTTVETEGSSTTTTTSSSSGTTSGKSVKTGDTTNIMPALISLIVAGLAVIALGYGIYRRRRRGGR